MKAKSISNIVVNVEVVIGTTELTLSDLASLGEGSIIELSALAGEPVLMKAGGQNFAKGEVVVIDECFGIRLTELVSVEE
ncbi:MAG: flagellar motor switch protein FliN [Spirochaetales bacterium]|nr:flagellar motor switch protein FliN [Spirochaetales bacterium]